MLSLSTLTYRIGSRVILEDASATVQEGWRVGLVGANGAGKSTLFKLIAGHIQADGGEISLSPKVSVGMVRQDLPEDDTPLLEIVLQADTERTQLLHAAETEQDPYKLADIHTRLNDIDAYAAPAKAATILAGLGFSEDDMASPISSFSGGWRMRVALAGALFQMPDLLLLDEPTNHLDLEAVMWLENYLATYPKTLVVISHDRELLNRCTTHIIHVENKTLTSYTGNYDTFERERAEKRLSQQKLHEKQKAQQEHMKAFVERFRAKASKARQAQSRLKALEKMTVVDAVMAERGTKFVFENPEPLPPPMLTLHGVDVGYTPNHPILKNLGERLDMDDRIALLGANGNGKSTLIKLLAGKLEPLAGSLEKSTKLRIGYFSQHQTEELDTRETPYQAMNRLMQKEKPGTRESDVRGALGRFGFGKDLADTLIGSLSGGEKSRLLFAFLSRQKPHLLLLDEPTNHLDMDAREALVQALNAYEGAVIIVSHDPSMVERVADRLWLVAGGTCQNFDGDIEAYRNYLLEQRRQEKRKGNTSQGPSKKERQKLEAEKKKAFPQLAKAVQEAEKELAGLGAQKKKLETKMASQEAYENPEVMKDLQQTYGHVLREIDDAEATYLEALEAFESAE